ncbi:hypothetical protein ABZ829_21995 [Streptomyces xanthochromogenes]|uniref:hypothetical protein n=1 Tax=Streptomyces xanthochromogenes TaxID=67384 RepID=UPI00342665DB
MQSDDKPVNGQLHPKNFFDLLDQTPQPTDLDAYPDTQCFAQVRTAWNNSWKEGGFLHERWEELRQAP